MIKVYFDWNVMSQMKNGLHSELKEIAFQNDNLFKPYSTSHINDIFSSFKENDEQGEIINKDLDFISSLTHDTFLFNNGKDIIINFAPPKEYYTQLVEEKDHYKDISFDGLFKHLEDDELTRDLVKPYLNLLKAFPLDDIFKETFENPQSAEQMEKLFPGLKENLCLRRSPHYLVCASHIHLCDAEAWSSTSRPIQDKTNCNKKPIKFLNQPK